MDKPDCTHFGMYMIVHTQKVYLPLGRGELGLRLSRLVPDLNQFIAVHYSAERYITIQCSTVRYSTVQ